MQSILPRSPDEPPPRRRVTFRNPEVEASPEGDIEDYSTEPSVLDVETWLEWQAQQLGTPAWWMEIRAILGIRDLQKLVQKIRASFYIPKVRMRASLESEYITPPAPKSLNRNAFLLNELSCQDVWQQLALLTITYARSLQYWAEKVSPLRSPDLHPLAGSVVELREMVREYVVFNHWDVVQDLGATHLEPTHCQPHATLFSHVLSLLGEEQEQREATTHAAMEEDMTRCITLPSRMERENQYLLLITTSVGQLNLGPGGNNIRRPMAGENMFQNPQMVATFTTPSRTISYGGAMVKELDE